MLDFLRAVKKEDYDFITFFEGDKKSWINVNCQEYTNRGDPVEFSDMGFKWHIILFRNHVTEDKFVGFDHFEAILLDPLEYISGLIPDGWFGIIAKKTTTSDLVVQKLLDKCKQMI